MISHIRIRHEGRMVQLIVGGKLIAEMLPWQAREIIGGLQHVTGLAEEIDQAERIVMDNAIMLRTGAPFGLIHDRHLLAESAKEAAWNSDLRRYLPGGVKSAEAFGVPTIVNHPPRPAAKEASHE